MKASPILCRTFRPSPRLLQQAKPMPPAPAPAPAASPGPPAPRVPSFDSAMKTRKTKLNPALLTYYKNPVYVTRGSMQWLWDNEDKRYLDLFGGIVTVSVGHCHPRVTSALKEQLDTLWHTTNIYLHPKIHEYAERLAETLPDKLNSIYFVNSGSEANDLAMYMARLYTGNYDIITFRNAYHGMSPYTMGLTAHRGWKFRVPTSFGIHHAMNPDPYKGLFGGKKCRDSPVDIDRECQCQPGECQATQKYIDQLEEVVRYSLPNGPSLAAFFAESIQGVGGTVQYPKGYLKKAFQRTRELGGVCISDEVQTGFGRTGDHFWSFESHDVVPDMVTMAKGIGNGFPLAAVVTTQEIAQVLTQATHFNTFGGNPMASAVGIAVLDALKEDGCQEISKDVGTYFLQELGKFREKYQMVGDVRGKGLMIGVEMVEDKSSKKPLSKERMLLIWEELKDQGVLVGLGGVDKNVFRIKPPMCITKADVDFAIDVFKHGLDKYNN